MKYRGVYWTVFAPMIRRSIRKRYGSAMAARAVRNGKREYRRLLARADDLGPGNPLALNAYSRRRGWAAAGRFRRTEWRT